MTGNTRQPLRTVAVLGSGITGLLAALTLSRALPGAGVAVIDLPGHATALADRFPAILPCAIDALSLAGLGEADLIAGRAITHKLADRFRDWPATIWMSGLGSAGAPLSPAAFHQSWLEAQRVGKATSFDRFSLAALLAEAGRFAHPDANARFDYALRLEPDAARTLLLRHCAARRIAMVSGTLTGIARLDDGGVRAIRLDGAREIGADLFLDCTGAGSTLAGSRLSWQAELPCDRLLISAEPSPAPSLIDDYQSVELGWQARLPLRWSTVHVFAYGSDTASEGKARRAFGRASEPVRVELAPGRQIAPWAGNVIALGDAAASPLPLGWPGLTLALADLALMVELLPGRDIHPGERAEYNRRATARADRLRDWQALLLLRSGRRHGAFWAAAAGRPVPDSLSQLLAQFDRRGSLPRHEEDVIERDTWLAALLGTGRMPERRDPVSMSGDPTRTATAMARLRSDLAGSVGGFPPYPQHLARLEAGR